MTVRLRHLAEINPPVPGWEQIPDDRLLTFVPLEAVWPRQIDFTRERPKSETSTGYTRFMEGDVIVPKITPTFEASRSTWVKGSPTEVLTGTTELHVVRAGPRLEPRYLDYLFSSHPFLHRGASQMVGVAGQKRISDEWLRNYRIPIVDLETQRKIADYLDTEASRVDALISKKRRLSDLFESRLIALAEDAIKGCNGVKATGIPSLSVIPASWQVLRNKVFMREVNRRSADGNDEMLSVSHITGVTPRSEKTVYMFEAESTVGYKLVRPGDLAINTMWAWMGAAGVSDVHGIVSPSYGVYEFDDSIMLPKFYDILVRTPAYIAEMTRFSRGVTSSRLRLYPDEFLRLSSPVPPIKTQKAIIERHASHESTATQARKRIDQQVRLLLERRQALITAVITGEMSVPRVAV